MQQLAALLQNILDQIGPLEYAPFGMLHSGVEPNADNSRCAVTFHRHGYAGENPHCIRGQL